MRDRLPDLQSRIPRLVGCLYIITTRRWVVDLDQPRARRLATRHARQTIVGDTFQRFGKQLLPVLDESEQPGWIVELVELVDVFVGVLLAQSLEAGRVQVGQIFPVSSGSLESCLRCTHGHNPGFALFDASAR